MIYCTDPPYALLIQCAPMQVCPHTIMSKKRRFVLLALSGIFLYFGFFFGPNGTLREAELFLILQEMYPTWVAFINDLILGLLFLVVISIAIHNILRIENRYSKKSLLYALTKKLDIRVMKNLLDTLSRMARWSLSLFASIIILRVMHIVADFYVPLYHSQPIVYCFAAFGLMCLFQSFTFWQKKLHSLFCFRISF